MVKGYRLLECLHRISALQDENAQLAAELRLADARNDRLRDALADIARRQDDPHIKTIAQTALGFPAPTAA